jgi:hypothetical protein
MACAQLCYMVLTNAPIRGSLRVHVSPHATVRAVRDCRCRASGTCGTGGHSTAKTVRCRRLTQSKKGLLVISIITGVGQLPRPMTTVALS